VETDFSRQTAGLEVATHGVGYLLLEFAKIFCLSGDASMTGWVIPRRHEQAGFIASIDPENDLFHASSLA
jgi:hypothetical protein